MNASSNSLVLAEYEGVSIGEHWNAAERIIGRFEALQLETYQAEQGRQLFQIGMRRLKATNWVGSIGVGHRCLDVVPKLDTGVRAVAAGQSRRNLLYMIARARRVPLSAASIAHMAQSSQPLLLAFLELYLQHLTAEWRRGAIRRYIHLEENRTFLKGKWLFSDHLKRNLIRQDRFYTRSDDFLSDNPISQILKAALRRCEAPLLPTALRRRARMLLAEFDEVSDRGFSGDELKQVQLDRSLQRYDEVFGLAKFILREISPAREQRARTPVYSLMFDMNRVFEGFIAVELQQALLQTRFNVRTQFADRSLLRQQGRPRFQLRPDIGVFRRGDPVCMIDTKWKMLDPSKPHFNVSQSDMYQMYAYGKEYRTPQVILLYPRTAELPAQVAEYAHYGMPPETAQKIHVATVDVSAPMGTTAATEGLRSTLRELVDYREQE